MNAFYFGIKKNYKIRQKKKWDPANLCDSYNFNIRTFNSPLSKDIEKIKIGLGYAVEIYFYHLIEHLGKKRKENDLNFVSQYENKFLKDLISAKKLDEIIDLMEDFIEKILDKYFETKNENIVLKKKW
ncbi:hypothetical protein XO12_03745 [Marinitoga sp. 1154]|uniref:hypothetical protein n=1 Tax=Marinitoga sp. 1154 TaxID=1643335 RepID=UPI0015861E7B|nr:hypothetical protein [Marinitoga sp. 1154]NUU99251.1 hypothetical protein [Marinitoga sp. 1154]